MQLPLSLLNAAKGKPILVELKNGETFNGHLQNCDAFMNLTLTEVYQTSNVSVTSRGNILLIMMMITLTSIIPPQTGEQFWKLPECYIRGSTVSPLRSQREGHTIELTSIPCTLQVKYCRVADALVDTVKEAEDEARKQRQAQGSLSGGVGLGVRGGRGGMSNRGGAQRGGGAGQTRGRGRGQH